MNDERGVYLFKDRSGVEDALMNWLGDRFDEDESLALVFVDESYVKAVSSNAATYEVICLHDLPPQAVLGYEILE